MARKPIARDMAPELAQYLSWTVEVKDVDGTRVILLPPEGGGDGLVVDLDEGLLIGPHDVQSVVSGSGAWTDEGLPTTRSVLERVRSILSDS